MKGSLKVDLNSKAMGKKMKFNCSLIYRLK